MPGNVLDVFRGRPFQLVPLTDAINVVPNKYGRLNELGLFPIVGTYSALVAVEYKNGTLNLVPTSQRGGPAHKNTTGKRKLKTFNIPHLAIEDQIKADDVANVRAFGTDNQLQPFMDLVNERQIELAEKLRITLEFFRNGALKGLVLDSDGTLLLDLWAELGVTQKVVYFDLDNADADVLALIRVVKRHIEDNLLGDTMSGVRCLCGETFFDKLVGHPRVRDAYIQQQALTYLQKDPRKGFDLQGVTFEEYRGQAQTHEGVTRRFIEPGEAHFFPVGTNQSFRTYVGPADFIETVNTKGRELYSKMAFSDPMNRWADLHAQMNPLPLCTRPALLVKGQAGAEG